MWAGPPLTCTVGGRGQLQTWPTHTLQRSVGPPGQSGSCPAPSSEGIAGPKQSYAHYATRSFIACTVLTSFLSFFLLPLRFGFSWSKMAFRLKWFRLSSSPPIITSSNSDCKHEENENIVHMYVCMYTVLYQCKWSVSDCNSCIKHDTGT